MADRKRKDDLVSFLERCLERFTHGLHTSGRARADHQRPALPQQGGQGGQGGQLFHTSRFGALAPCRWHDSTTNGGGCHSKDAKNANFFTRRESAPGSAGLPFVVHATANRARHRSDLVYPAIVDAKVFEKSAGEKYIEQYTIVLDSPKKPKNEAASDDELIKILREALRSDQVKSLLVSLIALANQTTSAGPDEASSGLPGNVGNQRPETEEPQNGDQQPS